ncbi:hypothetical protein CDD80_4311 [Ophiocordyceps camponoti-rufipedis]|uniref:Uncharacterized protein n=1 Tax=Ophiocordyceps camponoti-rufipedis TaxID=2004952 RepID=A0A2C5ZIZ6_9HYPO|nr:hypothetical protein CDD80_4311 [Ophiocordyceps camponoti-rufipedis]
MAPPGSAMSSVKTLVVPAAISLVLFVFLSLVLLPIWRRYRSRYGQYLPLESLSERTSSLRHRIIGRLPSLGPLATFLSGRTVIMNLDDGEELDDVDEEMWRAMERHVPTADSTRRLSRDLEEGFMDDSDG